MTTTPKFADILLPLALQDILTYSIPATLQLAVGQRVIVPLGKSKRYSGFVVRLHNDAPDEGITIKSVEDIVDDTPLLLPKQLEFWNWLAFYYMCTVGEVLKAALPSGLKLESEMQIVRSETEPDVATLSAKQAFAYNKLQYDKALSIEMLQKSGAALSSIRFLIDKGYAIVSEKMRDTFKPKTEVYIRLNADFLNDERLNNLFDTLKRSPKQDATLLAYLHLAKPSAAISLNNPNLLKDVSKKELLKQSGGSEAALKALLDKNILQRRLVEVGRLKSDAVTQQLGSRPLSDVQQGALNAINKAFEKQSIVLLHGVTSSGKTEVYTQLISQVINEGKQVLYLLPEIALTTQITTRLGRVFGDKMGVYHSKFPDAERVEVWRRQMSDQPFPLILGVRSSLFLPFRNLGLIIIDEEHETSYKQQDPAPRYHARDAALVLAQQLGAKVLLGTATPSLETYYKARTGRYGLVEMMVRHGGVQMPDIIVEDIKELQRKKLMKGLLTPRLIQEIDAALSRKEQVILFLNRRGFSPMLNCRTCGWTPRCTQCDVTLTFHQREQKLVCHYCGRQYDLPHKCPNCDDTTLRDMGYGTEKLEAIVAERFPAARLARMDLDTTRSRTAYENLIRNFQEGNTDILVGTQMLTKGLDFDRVSVVGIINADQLMNLPDFRAHERTFQMLSQVAGRAGRRNRRGLVILQTRQAAQPLILQIRQGNYTEMYLEQMEERQLFRYPPFYRIINIYLKHTDDAVVEAAAQYLNRLLTPHFDNCLLGPERPIIARVQLLYIRKFMLKVEPQLPATGVRATLNAAVRSLLLQEAFKRVHVYFDVDPL